MPMTLAMATMDASQVTRSSARNIQCAFTHASSRE
jgi:hypothetical protein